MISPPSDCRKTLQVLGHLQTSSPPAFTSPRGFWASETVPGSITQPSNANPAVMICFIHIPALILLCFLINFLNTYMPALLLLKNLPMLQLLTHDFTLYRETKLQVTSLIKGRQLWSFEMLIFNLDRPKITNHFKCFCTYSFRHSHSISEQC